MRDASPPSAGSSVRAEALMAVSEQPSPDRSPSLPRASSRGESAARRWLVPLLLVALYVGLRLAFLDSDPPLKMLHGHTTGELLVEPIAKASEARNWALFDTFIPNPSDHYQFWRPQSPVWVYPLALVFRVFGVSYVTLRLYSIAFCVVGLWSLLMLARRRVGETAMIVLGVFVAVDHAGILYERCGLLEPIVSSLLMLTLDALDRSRAKVQWLIAASALALGAFLVKQAAVVVVPSLLVFGGWALVEAKGVEAKWRWRAIVVVTGIALAGLLAFVVTRAAYQRGLTWNYRWVMLGKQEFRDIDFDEPQDTKLFPSPARLGERMLLLGRLLPATMPLALIETGRIAAALFRRSKVDRTRLLFAAYFASTFALLVAVKPTTVRYLLMIFAPAAFLAAAVVSDALSGALFAKRAPMSASDAEPATERSAEAPLANTRSRALRWGAFAILAGYVAFHAYGYEEFVTTRTRNVVEAAAAIRKHVGSPPRATIIGFRSAPIVFETPYQHFYVKNGFNETRPELDALDPTQLLLMPDRDETRSILQRADQEMLDRSKPVQSFRIYKQTVTLYDVAPR